MKCPILIKTSVGDQTMEMWVPVYIVTTKGLNGHNYPKNNGAIISGCLHHLLDRLIGTTAQGTEELSVVSEVYMQHLWDAEDVVSVGNRF